MKKTASVLSNLFTCCYRKSRPAPPDNRPPPNPTESSIKWRKLPEKTREILSGLFEIRLEEIKDLTFRERREKPAGQLRNPFQFQFIYRKLHGILEQKIPEREKEDFLKFVRIMAFPSKKKENWKGFLKKMTELTDQLNREKKFPHFKITLVEKSNTPKESKRPGESIEKSLDLVITHPNIFSRLFRKNEAEKELFKHLRPLTENIRIEACLNLLKGLCEFTIPYDFFSQEDLNTLASAGTAASPSSIVKVAKQITRKNLGHYISIGKGENTKTAFLLQREFDNSSKISPDRHAAVQKKRYTRRISFESFRTTVGLKNLELLALPNTFKRSEAHPLKLFIRFPNENDPEILQEIIAKLKMFDSKLASANSAFSKEPEAKKQSHEEWAAINYAGCLNTLIHPMNFIPAQTKSEEKKQEKKFRQQAKRVGYLELEAKRGSDGKFEIRIRPKSPSHSSTDRATNLEDRNILLDLALETMRDYKPDPPPKPDTLLPRPRPAVVSTQGNTGALESSETLLPSHTRDAPRGST